VDLQLAQVSKLLEAKHVALRLSPAARELLLREGYDAAYGARPLRRAIQRMVQDPLALEILDGKILPGENVLVDADPETSEMRFAKDKEARKKGEKPDAKVARRA
jgi:ATP-dependent Clp protease ATP-binding subunit ClpB